MAFMRFLLNTSTRISGSTGDNSQTAVEEISSIATFFKNLMKNIVGPVLIVIGAAAALYTIYLGVMYAKAEDANKRKDVQGRLIGAVIGVCIIIVGVILSYAINWQTLADNLIK